MIKEDKWMEDWKQILVRNLQNAREEWRRLFQALEANKIVAQNQSSDMSDIPFKVVIGKRQDFGIQHYYSGTLTKKQST